MAKWNISGRLRYVVGIMLLALLVPVGVLAEGLNDWSTVEAENALNLTAAPGASVSAWAGASVEWQSRNQGDAGTKVLPDVDEEETTLPAPHAVSTLRLRMPSPLGEGGEYVYGIYQFNFQAPDAPGEYRYVVKWAPEVDNADGFATRPDLTINLKVG